MKRVHIEFQRVQTWLFKVPRLRAMVGANALLGKVLRRRLRELALEEKAWKLAPCSGAYPSKEKNDPLEEHDDPAADARIGILARDGGHFEAQFESGAEAFANEAAKLLRRELPGFRFRISIDREAWTKRQAEVSNELPVLAPCQWSGGGLASTRIERGDDVHAVSLDALKRYEAADRSKAEDIASLLAQKTKLAKLPLPDDLDELAGEGYIALIHADGNGVGASRPRDEAAAAHFFHRNRWLMRLATQTAIDAVCDGNEKVAPLVPLMLGGDDLLVVCRAEQALRFVFELCQKLEKEQGDTGNGFKLTLGVGVVIAKPNIPIHRLHEVAEQLASSAKRRFRGLEKAGEAPRSVVDWAVYTSTWVEEPGEVRRRDWLRSVENERLVLSQRPLDVLGPGLNTLEGLLEGAEVLENKRKEGKLARSQLRYLVEQLSRGRVLAELAFEELAKGTREGLAEAGIGKPEEKARADGEQPKREWIWREVGNGTFVTPLVDLVEIFEIRRLGSRDAAEQPAKEVAHG